jgi:hypothetical protein
LLLFLVPFHVCSAGVCMLTVSCSIHRDCFTDNPSCLDGCCSGGCCDCKRR